MLSIIIKNQVHATNRLKNSHSSPQPEKVSNNINFKSKFNSISPYGVTSINKQCILKTFKLNDFQHCSQNGNIMVTNSFFSYLISPVRVSSAMDSDLQKGGKRKHFKDTSVKLKKLNFEFCHTLNENGGSVFVENCQVEVDACFFFQGNAINGGGLYATQGSVRILNSNAVKCNSKHNGGAYFFHGCKVTVNGGAILNNKAGKEAGAMLLKRCSIEIKAIKVYNNKATEKTGGIKIDQCDGFMNVCFFANNKAPNGPNSLYISEGDHIMIIEHIYFYTKGFELEFERKPNVRIVNPIFNGDELSMKGFGDSSNPNSYYVINPRYNGLKIPSQPVLPIELMRDVFAWKEIEPDFSWSNLYLIVAILVITFSAILIFIPTLLTPPTKEFNWDQLE